MLDKIFLVKRNIDLNNLIKEVNYIKTHKWILEVTFRLLGNKSLIIIKSNIWRFLLLKKFIIIESINVYYLWFIEIY